MNNIVFNKQDISDLMIELNRELQKLEISSSILLCGGASMCYAFGIREGVYDISAIYDPLEEIKVAISNIKCKYNLHEDWLNGNNKIFYREEMQSKVINTLSNLTIRTLTEESVLAMKLISARDLSKDEEDCISLVKLLKLRDFYELYDLVKLQHSQLMETRTIYLMQHVLDKAWR